MSKKPSSKNASTTKKAVSKSSKTTPKKTITKKVVMDEPKKTFWDKVKYKFDPKRQNDAVGPDPSSSWKLFGRAVALIKLEWITFLWIIVLFLLLNLVFVRGLGLTVNTANLKQSFEQFYHGTSSSASTTGGVFGVLADSAVNSNTSTGSTYQTIFFLVFSLAVIWSFRQIVAAKRAKVKDAFYKGMSPIVPFVLVFMLFAVELIPMLAAGTILSTVLTNNIAINVGEKLAWIFGSALVTWLSIYWITSSIFAVYIVTLPGLRPMQAIRSANQLVRFRRWAIIRKVFMGFFFAVVIGSFIIIPVIILSPALAEWLLFVYIGIAFIFLHSYLYSLYRELL